MDDESFDDATHDYFASGAADERFALDDTDRSVELPPDEIAYYAKANSAAADAMHAWLVTIGLTGLAEEIRDVAASDAEPIQAPGLDHLLSDAREAATRAAQQADIALDLHLADQLSDETAFEYERRTHLMQGRAGDAQAAADDAQHAMRRAAQLLLGMSAHMSSSDFVYQVERAATAILSPPAGNVPSVADDGTELEARTPDELKVELAGMVCRLLLQHGGGLTVRCRHGLPPVELELWVHDETLRATATGGTVAQHPEPFVEAGWEDVSDGAASAVWETPITVAEPVALVVTTLFDACSVEFVDDVAVSSRAETDPFVIYGGGRPR
jgi:hypothetical protein